MATLGRGNEHFTINSGIKLKKPNLRAVDGTTLFDGEKIMANADVLIAGDKSIEVLVKLISQPCGTAHRQLQLFRKYAYDLIQYHFMYEDLVKAILDENSRVLGNADRSRKRWMPEEDNLLIELASAENSTPMTLAVQFGRTPAAIQTRISYLVGINRISKRIAGRFVGWFNDELVEGDIDGVVTQINPGDAS